MRFITSPNFKRTIKKLHPNQKKAVDAAVKTIAADPFVGSAKKGDLSGVFVLRFKISHLEWLLAYEIIDQEVILLLLVGPHENFYRDLKRN